MEFIHPHHNYYELLTTPIDHFYSPTTQYHITPDIRIEIQYATAANATAYMPNTIIPTKPLSISTE